MSEETTMLSAREMFDTLLAGKKVGIISTLGPNDPEIIKLLNHLNVIKSRSRKIYESLGLVWENSVIQISPSVPKLALGEAAFISLTQPKLQKRYSAFIILTNNVINYDTDQRE